MKNIVCDCLVWKLHASIFSLRHCVKMSVITWIVSQVFMKGFQLIYLKGRHFWSAFLIFTVISSLKGKKQVLHRASLKQWPAEIYNSKSARWFIHFKINIGQFDKRHEAWITLFVRLKSRVILLEALINGKVRLY
jgi:hypothetical protein